MLEHDQEMTAPPAPSGPSRPETVPTTARWSEDEQEWQLPARNAAGELDGAWRSWRADGTLRSMSTYRRGKPAGVSWRFHPDGSLYLVGPQVGGAPHGITRLYGCEGPSPERLQSCCVPPGAWQLQVDYQRGDAVHRRWYDRAGHEILPSGEPMPRRPTGVPTRADFEEQTRTWSDALAYGADGMAGTRRCWSEQGALLFSEEIRGGRRHGVFRRYGEGGALVLEAGYADGRLSGPYRALELPPDRYRRHVAGVIGAEEGAFADEQAVGVWRLRDAAGRVVVERDLGGPVDDAALPASPALADEEGPAERWSAVARDLHAAGRIGEALVAMARAAAAAGDPGDLTAALGAWALPPAGDAAAAVATAAATIEAAAGKIAPLVDGLRRGQDAAALLRALAAQAAGADRAALDLATAAVLLAPERSETWLTRALVHAALGAPDAARADVARAERTAPEQAEAIAFYLRIHFPQFDFWPRRAGVDAVADVDVGDALAPSQPLPAICEVIQRYATRLTRLRAALVARLGPDVPFLLPDLAALLPDGPLPLRRWTFTMTAAEYSGEAPEGNEAPPGDALGAGAVDHAGDGANAGARDHDDDEVEDSIEITVDEEGDLAALVPAGAATPSRVPPTALLRRARSDWAGLTWLCWAIGLDEVRLPDAVRAPAAFGLAATATVERTWRCRDRLNTGGLLALTKGIPGFDWEGTPIDLVPAVLVDVALDEQLEARAVFS
jgi:antitoxin component YwqK of YwqJK toxin-antitoxin module/tetratricopeptide (TPR) repeat protein